MLTVDDIFTPPSYGPIYGSTANMFLEPTITPHHLAPISMPRSTSPVRTRQREYISWKRPSLGPAEVGLLSHPDRETGRLRVENPSAWISCFAVGAR